MTSCACETPISLELACTFVALHNMLYDSVTYHGDVLHMHLVYST